VQKRPTRRQSRGASIGNLRLDEEREGLMAVEVGIHITTEWYWEWSSWAVIRAQSSHDMYRIVFYHNRLKHPRTWATDRVLRARVSSKTLVQVHRAIQASLAGYGHSESYHANQNWLSFTFLWQDQQIMFLTRDTLRVKIL
jgi:hypothetical protein